MTLYSNELRQYVATRDWPHRLFWEVREFPDCLRIMLIRENINSLNSDEKLQAATTLNTVLNATQGRGVPIYTWVVTKEQYQEILSAEEVAHAGTRVDG